MANDVDPCRSTIDLENLKFAINENGKIVVRVEDETAIEILNDILTQLGGSAGTPHFAETQTTATGAVDTLINETVPALTTRNLSKVIVSCRQAGKINIKINSDIVGSGRTSASNMNFVFRFMPSRSAVAGDTISVEFEQTHGKLSDVEAYLMATDMT